MSEVVQARRKEATKAFARYFTMFFLVVLILSAFTAYAVIDARKQRSESRAIRIAYCVELEKLKTQNREDVARDKKNYKRNLRLLGLKDNPELHKAAEEGWQRRLKRSAPKSCPYEA